MNLKKTILTSGALLPICLLFAQSSGQNYTISPYSNFGLGEVLNSNIAEAGNNGQTYSGAYSYSFLNPATLGNIRFTAFDFGLNYRYGLVESGSAQRTFQGGGLSYMSLAFRTLHRTLPLYKDSAGIKKRTGGLRIGWNSFIGVAPVTSVGYNYTAEDSTPFLTRTLHSGKGGINSLQFGNSFSIGKNLSLGYSAAYLFGQLSDRSLFSAPDSPDLYLVEDEKTVFINGFQHQAGLMYQFELDSTYHRFGASYRWNSGMKASRQRITQVFGYNDGNVTSSDTILNTETGRQSFDMPGGFGVGYSFQWRKKWSIGLDYYQQLWGNYSAFFQPTQKLAHRTDYGFTFILNPMDEKPANAKKMPIPVRLGARISNTQNVFTQNNVATTVQEQSAFIGFGIPFVRRYYDNQVLRSMINVRVDYTTRGTTANGLAKEQYLVTTVSFYLGDVWFQRRKFD
jgi:hypothetical protein